ncbi:MAG: Tic22 family protein [Elainella sp.]
MKSFLRWSRHLTLVGSLMLGTLVAGASQVLALTQEQVIERLRSVPVFTLANAEGAPLIAVPTEGEQRNPIASVFINRQDAQEFLDQLKAREPQTAEGISVVPVPLAKIYEYGVSQQEGQEQLRFAFFPDDQQVQEAQTLLQQQSGQNQEFEGVPLFVARSNGSEGGYLTIEQDNQQVIPMFFDRSELQVLLDRLKQVQPDLASTVQVQVVNLEGVIQTLQTSDNQELNRIVLIPPQASREYIRSLQQNQGGQGGQNRPQAQPAQPQR